MRVFNSMTRRKEELVPLREGQFSIYACGPTVYDYFHIGNGRMLIVFDVLRRYLEYRGYQVRFVQNFTDIDDKMIRRANEEGITVKELSERFIREYFADAQALGIRQATIHPRATDHIAQIIQIIEKLLERGLAYVKDGNVYYRAAAFPGYGKLSGQNLEDLEAGARVDVDEEKEASADFALWKAQKPGEPAWDSPWGRGRPGWHIECSAMSMTYLGETFDIHCGGNDLLFPHHENEIAQSEGATGKPFVRYWMHNAFLNIENQKMSKSLNNFFTVRDILKSYAPEDVRMFMVSAHYRSPLNFSRELMEQAHASLARLYSARDRLEFLIQHAKDDLAQPDTMPLEDRITDYVRAFDAAMDDDMNTAEALGAMFDFVYDLNVRTSEATPRLSLEHALQALEKTAQVLGLLEKKADALPGEVQQLADERTQVRKEKNWKASDELRAKIQALGYQVEDTPLGQKISPTR